MVPVVRGGSPFTHNYVNVLSATIKKLEAQGPCTGYMSIIEILQCFFST